MISIVFVSSCTKEETGSDRSYIKFGVAEVNVATKALLTNESLLSTTVTVYGVKDNKTKVFNGVTIVKEDDSYNWKPENPSYEKDWQPGSYSFYGYTYSGPSNSCMIEKEGLQITVTQPETFVANDMIDYMLSHAYKVADGTGYHIVMLYMQHAMACAEFVVKQQIPEHDIILQSISLTGIYRSATMVCEDQANANSGGNNVWKTQISGSNDVVYSIGFNTKYSQDEPLGTMTILAVPQQLTQETKLTVVYSVDEDNNQETPRAEYTEVFDLFDYRPYVWESGNKIRYTLNINTGVELKAEIVDWIEAGYIEGVILPPKQ